MATKMLSTLGLAGITTGVALEEKGFAHIHEAIEWVVGHPVWTHELPAIFPTARALVLEQFPDMPTAVEDGKVQEVADSVVARYGNQVEVRQGSARRTKDPLTTLNEMFPRK